MPVRGRVSINLRDGVGRSCGNTFYVSEAEVQAWVAEDEAGRPGTLVGALIVGYLGETDAALVSVDVALEDYESFVSDIADTILRGNKLKFEVNGGGVERDFAIPCRKAAAFSQGVNSLQVSITAPPAMASFVDAYNDVVMDAFGNPRTIVAASIVD